MEENKTTKQENTKQKICPNCGEHLTPEQDVCPVCGLGYAAYMEVKSNPKAELAKLYELVDSYDGWSTPEEKKERRREERRKEREERRKKIEENASFNSLIIATFIFLAILICIFGLIPDFSFWIKGVGWTIIGGGCGLGTIILAILAIGGIGHGIIVLVNRNKEIPEVIKSKQRIKEIEATGVTYNYQRPKPKEEARPEPIPKKEEPIAGEYKGEVSFEEKNNQRKKEIERKINFVLSIILPILYILFTAFMLKKMDNKLGVFTNSLTGKIKLFGWFHMCWEDISILLILISMAMNITMVVRLSIYGIKKKYINNFVNSYVMILICYGIIILSFLSFLILGMVYGGGSVREESFIRWYWLYTLISLIFQTFKFIKENE